MHPTVDEQLQAVRRLLDEVAGDPGLSPGSRDALAGASRELGRLQGSWADRLSFLVSDNHAGASLLTELAPQLPRLAPEIQQAAAQAGLPTLHEDAAHETNKVLCELLARAVGELADNESGDGGRARIAAHLRARVAADPALQRNPQPRAAAAGPAPLTPSEGSRPTPTLTIGDRHFAEQFPLSPLDDHLIHQTPDPLRIMWTGDPRTYERYWMVCHDPAGEVLVAVGGSFYPNLDRAEAYAIVNHRGRHTTVRGFRRLGVDRADLRIGPMAPQIIAGMRWWRFVLEPNEWDISFQFDFRDTTRQTFREPLSNSAGGAPPGRRNDVTTGFESFGEVEGWVESHGTRIELPPGSVGTRDRHWGVGRGVGGPALSLGGRLHVGVSGNAFVAFPSWTLWGDRAFYRFGDPRPGSRRVGKPTRRLRFEPDTHIFVEGIVDYPLDSGEIKQVHYERIGFQTAYLRCGMYGGTPEGGIHQGGYEGPDLIEGETYDVTDPAVRTRLAGLDEHLCRATCDGEVATGIYQPIDPAAYQACAAGRPGWAFLD